MMTLITHAVAFVVGAGGGAWAWNKYKARAAAKLAQVATSVGK